MVQVIRKVALPRPCDVPSCLQQAADEAQSMVLREPRRPGFPLLFSSDFRLIEPAVAFLHEHSVQRAHSAETVRTYAEILYDWFETLEQNNVAWADADPVDLVAYRNRMMQQPSPHTGRPYRTTTINHRVRGVIRFYEWALRMKWISTSSIAGKPSNFASARSPQRKNRQHSDQSLFVLRQYEPLPRPLTTKQARELLAELKPPYDLMARWQLYTGLRVSELLSLASDVASQRLAQDVSHLTVEILRKGRKLGYVIASASLLNETEGYVATHRLSWVTRASRRQVRIAPSELFINKRGNPVAKNTYQGIVSRAAQTCGFKATTHLLRATFACMLLARLERLASEGAAVNPLLVVKVLMGHERISTTDRYLRAIAVDAVQLKDVLSTLLSEDK